MAAQPPEPAASAVRTVLPDFACYALLFVSVLGSILGFYGKKRTESQAWVECKNQKMNVKRAQIQKLLSSVDDVRAVETPKWRPRVVMMVSGTDFGADALNFARECGVVRYRRTADGFGRVS